MNAFRLARGAVFAAVGFMSAAMAGAAQITLFEHNNFEGGQLTLRGYTPSIVSTGFNDRASSIVVESGRWELCTDVDFKGTCVTLTRGEYPALDRRLNDRISSAREVGSNSDNRGSYNNYGRGSIELFGQPNFAGRSIQLDADASELLSSRFNDRASSLVVNSGTWQLCSDDGYRGTCRTYPPGRYDDLGYGMAKQVSSVRLVRTVRDAPAVVAPGYGGPAPVAAGGVGRIILYSDNGLNGNSVAISGAVGDLDRTGVADGASSAYVESGSWTLCADPFYAGACVVVGPGRYDNLSGAGLARRVLSVRPASADPAPAFRPGSRAGLELYSDPDFGGERFSSDRDVSQLDRGNFNDRAASAIIFAGQWEFCSDFNYGGSCAVYGPGRYPRLGGMTRQLSSVRRIQ